MMLGIARSSIGSGKSANASAMTRPSVGSSTTGSDTNGRLRPPSAALISAGGPGMAVMRLVRVDHDDAPGRARLRRPAVVEALQPGFGDADCIGLVAVPVVGVAGEAGAHRCSPVAGISMIRKSAEVAMVSLHERSRPPAQRR